MVVNGGHSKVLQPFPAYPYVEPATYRRLEPSPKSGVFAAAVASLNHDHFAPFGFIANAVVDTDEAVAAMQRKDN